MNAIFSLQAAARRDASPYPTFVAGLQFCRRSQSSVDLSGKASEYSAESAVRRAMRCADSMDE